MELLCLHTVSLPLSDVPEPLVWARGEAGIGPVQQPLAGWEQDAPAVGSWRAGVASSSALAAFTRAHAHNVLPSTTQVSGCKSDLVYPRAGWFIFLWTFIAKAKSLVQWWVSVLLLSYHY